MKLDPRLILVAVVTVFGNAYIQYLKFDGEINWTNAILVGLVVTALLPLLMKKRKK
ncbi:MAG: LPXTG cell wall anchor domain-containing protein [Bacillota bacterium]